MAKVPDFEISGEVIKPGEQRTIDIPLAAMVTHNDLQMTTHIVHGKRPGPVLFVCAAIHGDEINGVEIIRRLLKLKQLNSIRGTLIAIPVVNVYGFISHSRYLPDGRDLNRSFPGSSKGSLAARIAYTFFNEVLCRSTHGIDLHTGARHRDNLPQIRADLSNEETRELAFAFGVPAILDSEIRDGSLRQAAGDENIPVLLYEAGEALRFDEFAIRAGVRGVQNVMRAIGMLPKRRKGSNLNPLVSSNTAWVRAPHSGILRATIPLGAKIEKNSVIGIVSDPLGQTETRIQARAEGMLIGRTNLPLVHEGDALFHVAYYSEIDEVIDQMETFQEMLEPESTELPQ